MGREVGVIDPRRDADALIRTGLDDNGKRLYVKMLLFETNLSTDEASSVAVCLQSMREVVKGRFCSRIEG